MSSQPHNVTADLNYRFLDPSVPIPDFLPKDRKEPQLFFWINDPKTGEARDNALTRSFPTTIHDLRGREAELSIDREGFGVVKGEGVWEDADWEDEGRIEKEYYKLSEELIKKQTGASRVVFFDHTIRRQDHVTAGVADTPQTRQPVPQVHVDQTDKSAENRVRRHTGADAERLLKSRFQIINLWRPLRKEGVWDVPLALADYRTLDEARDLHPSDLIYAKDNIGETLAVTPHEDHRFYWLSGITREEAILIKCFDTKPGVAKLTPHTAFIVPEDQRPAGYLPRQSIELRALVFYEDQPRE